MRKVLGGLCIVVVGLQILIGVPLAICIAFFACLQSGGLPSMVVEVHAGPRLAATVPPINYPEPVPMAMPTPVPPPNKIPATIAATDNPILLSRLEQGSPLAGTILAGDATPEEEQQLFLTALEKAATEAEAMCPPVCIGDECLIVCSPETTSDEPAAGTEQLACHLYAMAELDEQACHFERADQWRALARELRTETHSEPLP